MTKQLKKHVSYMSLHEINYLQNILEDSWANVQRLNLSYHLRDKITTGKTVYSSVLARECIQNFRECLFEFNITTRQDGSHSPRVALRSKGVLKNKGKWYNQIIVVDIYTLDVITSYLNHVNDKHKTLDDERYTNFEIGGV